MNDEFRDLWIYLGQHLHKIAISGANLAEQLSAPDWIKYSTAAISLFAMIAAWRAATSAARAARAPALLKLVDDYSSRDMNKALQCLGKIYDLHKEKKFELTIESAQKALTDAGYFGDSTVGENKMDVDTARSYLRNWVKAAWALNKAGMINCKEIESIVVSQNGYNLWLDIGYDLTKNRKETGNEKNNMAWADEFNRRFPRGQKRCFGMRLASRSCPTSPS